MTASRSSQGGFCFGSTMSEEITAIPEAVANAPSDSQTTQDQTTTSKPEAEAEEELAETWPDAEPEQSDEAEGEDEKDEDEKPRKPSRSERLRRQNERLRAENEALKSGSAHVAVTDESSLDEAVRKKIGDPPKEADFKDDWFAFEAAKQAYEVDRRLTTREVKQESERAVQARHQRIADLADDYQDNLERAAKAVPDLRATLEKSTYVPTELVTELVLTSGDKAPLIVYHLAQNPKLAARLNAMSPIEAAREIGRIEGKVSLPKPKTATSATPPLSSVKGSASPQRGLGKSMSDYERWRNS